MTAGHALIDVGGGARLERLGARVTDRPHPAALGGRRDPAAWRTPDLRFRSTGVRTGDGRIAVDGELEVKGVTRPVTLEGEVGEQITDPYGRERIGITLGGTIDRTDFGINWNNPLPSGKSALANEVTLDAELYLVKE